MSVESLAIALHHSRAAGTAKLVLVGIANHDGDGGAWPAVATLAKYAGISDRRAVQRAILKLEALGEIRRIVKAGGDHDLEYWARPNLYRFTLACPHDCDRTTRHRTSKSVPLVTFEDLHSDADGDAETPRSFDRGAVIRPGGEAVIRPHKPSLEPIAKELKRNPSNRAREISGASRSEDLAPCGHAWMQDNRDRYCEFGHNTTEEISK